MNPQSPGPLGPLDWCRYADQLWAETCADRDTEWHAHERTSA